jgi:hypothetical protein
MGSSPSKKKLRVADEKKQSSQHVERVDRIEGTKSSQQKNISIPIASTHESELIKVTLKPLKTNPAKRKRKTKAPLRLKNFSNLRYWRFLEEGHLEKLQ